MPLGNLTSQFFANVYLNELDYFIKHKLKAKHYIRYVDDFIILHKSKKKLEIWKEQIETSLRDKLKLQLHPDKSKINPIYRGIDFVGYRNLKYFKLLRKRSIRKIKKNISRFKNEVITKREFNFSLQGWQGHAKWANTFKLRQKLFNSINTIS